MFKVRKIGFVGLLFLTFCSWTRASTLEGVVKDPSGRPIQGADVRIEGKNGSKFSKIAKTDFAGHYISDGLAAGTYKVTLLVNGSIKASILNAYAQSGKTTKLNFALTQKTGPGKTHMVWMAPDTGTHIGGGRWVEVDENGRIVNNSGPSAVDKVSAKAFSNVTDRPRSPTGN